VSVVTAAYSAKLKIGGALYPLDLTDGVVTIDEGWVPYVQASVNVFRPALSVYALMDPTASTKPRVILTMSSNPGSTLTLSLMLSSRQLDAGTGTLGLSLQGDEQYAMDYKPSSTLSYRINQDSARAIVTRTLSQVLGVTTTPLYASGSDIPYRTYSDLQNLIPVGSFEYASGLWSTSNATVTQTTDAQKFGKYCVRLGSTTAGDSYMALTNPGLQAGETYTVSGWIALAGQPYTGTPDYRARSIVVTAVVNGVESVLFQTPQVVNSVPAGWQETRGTFTMPTNATGGSIRLYNGAAQAGFNVFWDGVSLWPGNGKETDTTPLVYFDGDTADTAYYRYDWDGQPGVSTSRRTALQPRDPASLDWTPDQSAWDFLTPILQVLGLRLFVDVDGRWYLTNGATVSSQVLRLSTGNNLYGATDLMSRTATQPDGTPLFVDAVIMRYTWTDAYLGAQEAWDIVAPAGYQKPVYVDLKDTPFPGIGAASYRLQRYAARRRALTATGTVDWTVRPNAQITVSTPDGGIQSGVVDSVSWDLGQQVMSIVTKGTVSTPSSAWINKTTTWAALTGTWAAQ
jgi:hypothetical protein